ncbi:hypothetical protein [uncultured Sphingomonas sp.]|mgnify:CR=1 FL=1|uniref:hypothetical protein n=1 Tax=uncultured Sphingomonas sp. TaxID=158754 RepID=UPI0025E1C026|nr:hypothetical protein [uncultured Sphingomonas sp.]
MRFAGFGAAIAAALVGTAASGTVGSYRHNQQGTLNPANYAFWAAANGDLTMYTMTSTGTYLSKLGVKVIGKTIASGILPSGSRDFKATNLGKVLAGDSIEFFIDVDDRDARDTHLGTYSSVVANNADGLQHLYASTHLADP